MKKLQLTLAIVLVSIFGTAFHHSKNYTISADQESVKIGKQIWMARNLDVVTFRNGDTIPEAKTPEEWKKAFDERKPAWCYLNNDPQHGKQYGKLYNWYAIDDKRGLAPEGWAIPSLYDFTDMATFLKEKSAGTKLKHYTGWLPNDGKDGNGNNKSNFGALPAGWRKNTGDFGFDGIATYYWTTSAPSMSAGWAAALFNHSPKLNQMVCNFGVGCSVRCIKSN